MNKVLVVGASGETGKLLNNIDVFAITRTTGSLKIIPRQHHVDQIA